MNILMKLRSASIFKRMSDTPEQHSPSILDYTAAYKVRIAAPNAYFL